MGHRFKSAAAVFMAAAAFVGTATAANAVIISSATPIPLTEVLVNFNNSGLDWVYAGPIAPNEFGAGNIQPASYRAAEGWRVASVAEWAARPIWSDFIRPGFTLASPQNGFTNHSIYIFAPEYWSNFSHVDMGDFANGRVTDGVNGVLSGVPETIYVRNSAGSGAVPEPATWAMMLVGFAAIGGAMRSRKTQQPKVRFAF